MKRIHWIQLLVLLGIFLVPHLVAAQSGPGDPGGDPDAPIDGGLSLLIAAGAGYVVKKGRDMRKKKLDKKEMTEV